jgi:multiple antibiotic resistance protein
MMEFLQLWLSIFGLVFAAIDPFGFIPIFLSMTAKTKHEARQWMLKKACVTSFIVLTLFSVGGNFLLHYFGISMPALQISGGLILIVIGFNMLQLLPLAAKLSDDDTSEATEKEDISIVPLAIPMLAGPASFTTVAVVTARMSGAIQYSALLSSIFCTLLFTYVILRFANQILSFVGIIGIHVMTRLMGLLLCAMAVQFIINGYIAIR